MIYKQSCLMDFFILFMENGTQITTCLYIDLWDKSFKAFNALQFRVSHSL
jgi:hypothetical protein